ncbi:MAG: hypothetical protein FWG77_11780 [Treponema sp.]|nr:hypothetical protein [Treponema sp.]
MSRYKLIPLFFCLLIIFFTTASPLFSLGRREKNNMIRITGVVRLVGNEPFTEIVISGPEREWHIAPDEVHKLHDLQHKTVTVEAVEVITVLRFANGFPAGERYTLDRIRVISVEED